MNGQKKKTTREMFGIRFGEIMRKRSLEIVNLLRLLDESGLSNNPISENTVRGWYYGTHLPRPELLVILANVLSVTTDYLLGVDDKDLFGDINDALNGVMKNHGRYVGMQMIPHNNRYIQRINYEAEFYQYDIYSKRSDNKQYFGNTIESEYIAVDGNIYTKSYYEKFKDEIHQSSESIYNIVNNAVSQGSIGNITAIRKEYNANRASFGILGSALRADDFIILCYTLGYFAKKG